MRTLLCFFHRSLARRLGFEEERLASRVPNSAWWYKWLALRIAFLYLSLSCTASREHAPNDQGCKLANLLGPSFCSRRAFRSATSCAWAHSHSLNGFSPLCRYQVTSATLEQPLANVC